MGVLEKLAGDAGVGDVVDVDVLLADEVEEEVEGAVVDLAYGDGERRLGGFLFFLVFVFGSLWFGRSRRGWGMLEGEGFGGIHFDMYLVGGRRIPRPRIRTWGTQFCVNRFCGRVGLFGGGLGMELFFGHQFTQSFCSSFLSKTFALFFFTRGPWPDGRAGGSGSRGGERGRSRPIGWRRRCLGRTRGCGGAPGLGLSRG